MLINPTLAGLTLRQALARRRWLIVTLLAAVPIVVAVLGRIYATDEADALGNMATIFPALIFTAVVPIIALLLAGSSFGAEIDDGTVIYLVTKPIRRSEIVLTKLTVTALICALLGAASTLIAGIIMLGGLDSTRLVVGFTVAAALGSVLYTAIFLALGLITRRGMLVGLTYLIVWEGVLGRLFVGTQTFSIRQYMLAVADAISSVDSQIFSAPLPASTAWPMSVVIAVGAAALCIYRLRRFQVGQSG